MRERWHFSRVQRTQIKAQRGALDGIIPVEPGIDLGYRFYNHRKSAVIICFHGNGEIATDYDELAQYYRRHVGASLLVVDYRGYGWSTGKPTFKTLDIIRDKVKWREAAIQELEEATEGMAGRHGVDS